MQKIVPNNLEKIAIITVLVAILGAGGYYAYKYYKERKSGETTKEEEPKYKVKEINSADGRDITYTIGAFLTDGGVFEQDAVIGNVGEIEVKGRTLNYFLLTDANTELIAKQTDEAVTKAKTALEEHFLVLNAAIGNGWITIDEITSAQNAHKDLSLLYTKTNEFEEKLASEDTSVITYEKIGIWFKNTFDPEMGIEAAKTLTRQKIDAIRAKLISGELKNLEDAGKVIAADSSLAEIDPSYKGNAYFKEENVNLEDFIASWLPFDPNYREMIMNLPVGSYSEVVMTKDANPVGTNDNIEDMESYDAKWEIFYVHKRSEKEFQSFSDLLNYYKTYYEITWNQ